MKKFMKITSLLIVLCMCFSQVVSAQTITIKGFADPSAKGVSILVTKTPMEKNQITSSDIVWIDQRSINANGSFELSMPLFTEEGYTVHSNALVFSDENSGGLTLYISESGTGHGFDAENPSNLAKVYSMLGSMDAVTIVLTGDVTYSNAPKAYSEKLTIKGQSGTEKLNVAKAIGLAGDLTIDNLVISNPTGYEIFACGYELVITDKVTSAESLTVYGGSYERNVNDTCLKLYGGSYANVYGGSKRGTVSGNTNIIFGGNATALRPNSDASYQCVYGGGEGGAVNGKTNITLEGNAKADFLVGAGKGDAGTATDTNINITGGEVMNVYGGSRGVALTNCNTHITMTGGKAEALFGGCESKSLTGNTYITVKAGEVTRRIYGGCYNNASGIISITWASTDNHVTGTTNIFLYPGVKLATGSGLSWDNMANMGVFGGSRRQKSKATSSDEMDTIFFMDGSYSSLNSKIGEKGSFHTSQFASFHDYMVNSAAGGEVIPVSAGSVEVKLPQGKSALSGGKRYFDGEKIALTSGGTTAIAYDGISSVEAVENAGGVTASVGMDTSTAGELFVAVYDENGVCVSCALASVDTATKSYTLPVECTLEANKKYSMKLYFWSEGKLVPITTVYTLQLR